MFSRIPNPDGDKPTPGTKGQRWHHWKSARFKSIRATARARRRLRWGARGCRELIAIKPATTELVLTGRGLLPLADLADLVTEMRPVKHYFDEGFLARQGIEY